MTKGETRATENASFTQQLQFISDLLRERGKYSIVGGLAVEALLGVPVSARRANGTLRDFDAVALGPNTDPIKKALDYFELHRSVVSLFPAVGIETVVASDEKTPSSRLTMLSSMRRDSKGRFFLVYRGVEVEIPEETIQLNEVYLNGVPFSCFPAKTILYRYLVRGAIMKPKDEKKIFGLEKHIVSHWDKEPADELYRPYLAFAEEVRERYPRVVGAFDAYWRFDNWTGGRMSSDSGFLYKFIALFHS